MRVAQAWLLAIGAGCVGASLGSAATWYLLKDDVAATPVVAASARSSVEATSPGLVNVQARAAPPPADAPETMTAVEAAPAEAAPTDDAATRSLELAAAQRAHAVLDSAIARHEWTEADGAALRETFATLPAADRDAILSRFAVAVNRGTLVPRTERIPF